MSDLLIVAVQLAAVPWWVPAALGAGLAVELGALWWAR